MPQRALRWPFLTCCVAVRGAPSEAGHAAVAAYGVNAVKVN